MSLINVTRKERNGVASVSDDLITTDKIAYAIREIAGEAYISVIESPLTGRGSENIVVANYLVAESVATICATTASLFTATVVTRDDRTPSTGYTALGFVAEKIMGPIMTEGTGAKFLYHEDNASNPVVYIVSETPADIIAQTGTGVSGNVYTENGTLTGKRTVQGDGYAFGILNADKITLGATTQINLNSSEINFNGYQSLVTEEVELTAADIIGMNASPVVLVPAISGYVIDLVDTICIFDYGTTQFTGGGDVTITVDTGSDMSLLSASKVLAAADSVTRIGIKDTEKILVENKGLLITNDTAPFATGDGVLRVIVTYRLFATGL